ncbi:MAG: hypothetical protein ACFFAU_00685 [Candidatus Hodarchaeota archaeon]
MFLKSKQIIFYTIILSLISLNTILAYAVDSTPIEDPIVILFDEAHEQFFNRTLYSAALSDLKTNFTENEIKIIYNTNEFNKTTFQGVDIFICTNPADRFSEDERQYVADYLAGGKSMFLLSNPLDEENKTLIGGNDYLNDLLVDYRIEMFDRFWVRREDIGDFKNPDVVINEFYNAGVSKYLKVQVNTSFHEILYLRQNVTSLITYSSSIDGSRVSIVQASDQAQAITVKNEMHVYPSGITLLSTPGELPVGARLLMGGSSIMFSDLNDTILGTTWYESANNSILWLNCIDWLAETNPEALPPEINFDQVIFTLVIISFIAGLFIIVGSVFFFVGSKRRVTPTKISEIIAEKEPKREKVSLKSVESGKIEDMALKPESKISKRDRRLKQIQKHSKGRKK